MIDLLVRLDDISNVLSKGKRRIERIPDADILSLDAYIPPENCPSWCLSEEAKAKFNITTRSTASSSSTVTTGSRKSKKRKSNKDEEDSTESSSDSAEETNRGLSREKKYNKRHRQRKYKEQHH